MSKDLQPETAAAFAAEFRRREWQKRVKWLSEELRDGSCTGWTCPECGWSEYKVYGLECDQCGFDAEPYVPRDHRGLPIVRVQAGTELS